MGCLCNILHRLADACEELCEPGARLIPGVGGVREQTGPAAPTPEHQGRYLEVRVVMAFQMTASQQCLLSVQFVDSKGNVAEVDEPPQWFVDLPSVLALYPVADGMSCGCAAVGPLGTALVTVRADADLGAGTQEIVGTLSVEITAGTATTVQITPGTPSEQV